jgi:hypothetical protein
MNGMGYFNARMLKGNGVNAVLK